MGAWVATAVNAIASHVHSLGAYEGYAYDLPPNVGLEAKAEIKK